MAKSSNSKVLRTDVAVHTDGDEGVQSTVLKAGEPVPAEYRDQVGEHAYASPEEVEAGVFPVVGNPVYPVPGPGQHHEEVARAWEEGRLAQDGDVVVTGEGNSSAQDEASAPAAVPSE